MTVEKMIVALRMRHTLGGKTFSDVEADMSEQIIAALEAGKIMSESFCLDGEEEYAVFIDKRKLAKGGIAWDAATKED